MKCPVDGETLVMTERSGVEIDYCPTCRGVWLDRGELDKIIERAPSAAPQGRPERGEAPYREQHPREQHRHPQRKKKKESFLGELFDF